MRERIFADGATHSIMKATPMDRAAVIKAA